MLPRPPTIPQELPPAQSTHSRTKDPSPEQYLGSSLPIPGLP